MTTQDRKKGKLKFFDEAKGFGFVVDEDNNNYYVHKKHISSAIINKKNEPVTFLSSSNEKGLYAYDLVFSHSPTSRKVDRSETCPHCHNVMLPRIIFSRGYRVKKVCGACGETLTDFLAGQKKAVYIVVACYFLFWFLMMNHK